MFKQKQIVLTLFTAIWMISLASAASACGGSSCTTSSQQTERIMFLQNGNDTMSAIVQLNYEGDPDRFSAILTVKSGINIQTDVSIPDRGLQIFDQLSGLTDPRYIAPYIYSHNSQCDRRMREGSALVMEYSTIAVEEIAMKKEVEVVSDNIIDDSSDYNEDEMAVDGEVEVLSEGIVGNYAINVVGSDDPDALITWLNSNQYTVTPEMKPLITAYAENGFNFLAVKWVAGRSGGDIVPIQIDYEGNTPMIPLQVTPVGAESNRQLRMWVFADTQAVPLNYESIRIPDEAVVATYSGQGGAGQHDYLNVVNQMVDQFDGRAFVTEYARETKNIELDLFHHGWLPSFMDDYDYLTRFNTFIDPDQMNIDPIFGYDASLEPLDRIHDLGDTYKWRCGVGPLETKLVPITSINQLVGNSVDEIDEFVDNSNQFTLIVATVGTIGVVLAAAYLMTTSRNKYDKHKLS